jgi:hypothetical protein
MQNDPVVLNRSCAGCTKCCEGELSLEVRGIKVSYAPCPFVKINEGCGIYSDPDIRNDSVCSLYKCDYLTNEKVPEEFKPSLSNFIIETYEDYETPGEVYLRVIQTGWEANEDVIKWAENYGGNLVIRTWDHGNRKLRFLGTPEFIARKEADEIAWANKNKELVDAN